MARPPKDNLDYFPHDCKASSDERLEILEIKYPNGLGYTWYFKTLERIYFHQGELDVSEAETKQILCRNLDINAEEIIEYSVKIGLFDKNSYYDNGILTSNRIKSNVKPIIEKRIKMANRYGKQVSAAEIPPETGEETDIVKESKRKVKVKEKNIKHKYGEFNNVLLTDDELQKLKTDLGESEALRMIKVLDEGMELKGYKYKSCYLAIKKWYNGKHSGNSTNQTHYTEK